MRSISKSAKLALPLILITFLYCSPAFSFPELIRSGYNSCSACHVAGGSGAGPINAYGRTIAGDHLSTWGTPEEAGLLYGYADAAPYFDVAGDVRYLQHHFDDKDDPNGVVINQKFFMQKEASLIFNPAENVSFVFSGGYYGFEPKEPEFRRYFGIVHLGGLWARAGRFLPAFGYDIPDHTKGIKELFGQGKETLNFEVGYTGKRFELIATRILGSDSTVSTDKNPKVQQNDSRDGFAGKANIFIGKGFQLGSSVAFLEDDEKMQQYYSVHAFAGTERIYSLVEYQSHPEGARKGYAEIGWQVFKGMHLKAELNMSEVDQEIFGSIQWFPRPHWELTASASERQWFLVTHYYL